MGLPPGLNTLAFMAFVRSPGFFWVAVLGAAVVAWLGLSAVGWANLRTRIGAAAVLAAPLIFGAIRGGALRWFPGTPKPVPHFLGMAVVSAGLLVGLPAVGGWLAGRRAWRRGFACLPLVAMLLVTEQVVAEKLRDHSVQERIVKLAVPHPPGAEGGQSQSFATISNMQWQVRNPNPLFAVADFYRDFFQKQGWTGGNQPEVWRKMNYGGPLRYSFATNWTSPDGELLCALYLDYSAPSGTDPDLPFDQWPQEARETQHVHLNIQPAAPASAIGPAPPPAPRFTLPPEPAEPVPPPMPPEMGQSSVPPSEEAPEQWDAFVSKQDAKHLACVFSGLPPTKITGMRVAALGSPKSLQTAPAPGEAAAGPSLDDLLRKEPLIFYRTSPTVGWEVIFEGVSITGVDYRGKTITDPNISGLSVLIVTYMDPPLPDRAPTLTKEAALQIVSGSLPEGLADAKTSVLSLSVANGLSPGGTLVYLVRIDGKLSAAGNGDKTRCWGATWAVDADTGRILRRHRPEWPQLLPERDAGIPGQQGRNPVPREAYPARGAGPGRWGDRAISAVYGEEDLTAVEK
jgi:hypothetical protein